MPAPAAAAVTIRDYPSGLNVLTLDVDPTPYSPFQVPIRGSATKVLDGTVVRQFFGLNQRDWTLELQGFITDLATLEALWSRYKSGGNGTLYELRDWYQNAFVVVFSPGGESFAPRPIPGAINGHTYQLHLTVCAVLTLFGSAY